MTNKQWVNLANRELAGECIKNVRLATDEECNNIGAEYSRPFIITFDSGKLMWASSDDEGNDIGVFIIYDQKRKGKFKEVLLPRINQNR